MCMSMYNHNFCCEVVLILSKVSAEFHIDTMNKTNGAKMERWSGFQMSMTDAMFEFGANL